ncbi:MAG: hypothetical protein HN531_10160 [Opitutae bacterium]|nr:hypothetical protein [Opitutae bacterium]
MKNLLTLFPLLASLFFLGCGKGSSSDDSSPLVPRIEVPGAKSNPMAYAKTIALPKLIQKAVEVANAVKPGPQSAMLPMMVGLALGDPALGSIDPDAPCTVLLFDDFKQSEPTFVLAMKLKSDSPVAKQAQTVGLRMIEKEGWTLATMTPGLFDEVTDWTSVLSFAEEAPGDDIEAGVLLGAFWKVMPEVRDSIAQELGSQAIAQMLQVMFDELASLDATKFELSLSAEEITLGATTSARKDSELHALFSSEPKPFSLDSGKYISGGGWMDALVNVDSASLLQYVESVIGRINENTQDAEAKALANGYLALIREGTKIYDGQVAMSYGLSEDGNPLGFVQVGSTQASPDELKKFVSESVVLGQEMFSNMEIFESMGLKYDFAFEESAPIDGVEVFKFGMKMDAEGLDGEEILALAPYSNTNTFFAVLDGKYLAATSKDKLAKLLQAVKTGKPAKNNLAEKLSLEEGEIISWRLDVARYAQVVMSMVSVGGENPLGELMDGLLALNVPPVTGKFSLGKGRLSSEMRIPVKSIKAGFDYFESASQSQF